MQQSNELQEKSTSYGVKTKAATYRCDESDSLLASGMEQNTRTNVYIGQKHISGSWQRNRPSAVAVNIDEARIQPIEYAINLREK